MCCWRDAQYRDQRSTFAPDSELCSISLLVHIRLNHWVRILPYIRDRMYPCDFVCVVIRVSEWMKYCIFYVPELCSNNTICNCRSKIDIWSEPLKMTASRLTVHRILGFPLTSRACPISNRGILIVTYIYTNRSRKRYISAIWSCNVTIYRDRCTVATIFLTKRKISPLS